jgi:hypothetical protein
LTTTSIPLVIMLHDLSGGGPACTPPGHGSVDVHREGESLLWGAPLP